MVPRSMPTAGPFDILNGKTRNNHYRLTEIQTNKIRYFKSIDSCIYWVCPLTLSSLFHTAFSNSILKQARQACEMSFTDPEIVIGEAIFPTAGFR